MSKAQQTIHFTIFEEFFPKTPTKSERRKIQIIEKTISELATSGVDATNYESLAKACGITRALVQHYFPDREELILVAMRFVRAKYQKLCVDAISARSNPKDQLRAYIETACSWPKVAPLDAKVWLLFYYNCSIKKKYRKLNTELVEQGHERVTELIKRAAGDKKLPTGINYAMRAKVVQGMILTYFLNTLTEDQSQSLNDEFLASTLEICLHLTGAN